MARIRRSREQWAKLIDELESSGLTVAEFARQQRLTLSSVHRWRTIFRNEPGPGVQPAPRPPVSFVEVVPPVVATEPGADAWLEIGDGLVLRFSHLPEPAYVAQLAKALAV